MSKQNTITINGVLYDAHTGMRLGADADSLPKNTAPAALRIHKRLQHSRTLDRSVVAAPTTKSKPAKQPARTQVKKSPHITKFGPKMANPPRQGKVMSDIGPAPHPIVAKRTADLQRPAATSQHMVKPELKPANEIKKQAIEKALVNAKPAKKHKRPSFAKRHPRLISVTSVSLAVLLFAGYLSYINMPNLSVRLAAAQAGIAATYPSYKPSGYSLSGPVAYANGQVTMKFAANAGPQNYTLRQTKSSWDSSAVLENYIEPESNGDYTTYSDGGLTIYTYGTNAAWVNGGILYTLNGNAPLSNDQIRHIAASM